MLSKFAGRVPGMAVVDWLTKSAQHSVSHCSLIILLLELVTFQTERSAIVFSASTKGWSVRFEFQKKSSIALFSFESVGIISRINKSKNYRLEGVGNQNKFTIKISRLEADDEGVRSVEISLERFVTSRSTVRTNNDLLDVENKINELFQFYTTQRYCRLSKSKCQ